MAEKRCGFTLLELLITIIIIGILAAIAVPQFFSMAERTRVTEGVNILSVLKDSLLRYYSETAKITNTADDLDVSLGQSKFFDVPVLNGGVYMGGTEVLATVSRNSYQNNGYGNYTLNLHGNGEITCTDTGGTCPPGF